DQTDVFRRRASVPRRARQAIERFARLGLSGEQPWQPPRYAIADAADDLAILRVDVGDLAVAVAYHGAERQAVDDRPRHGARLFRRREPADTRGQRGQAAHPA